MALLKSMEGQKKWLKIDVVRIQYVLGGKDATNVYPDGHVRYKLMMGFRSAESTSVDEFTKDVHRTLDGDKNANAQIRTVGRGSPVTITKAEAKDDDVEIEIRDSGGSKNKIRYKFKDAGDYAYTAPALKKLFAVTFADSEAEANGEKPTVTIALGMTIDAALAAKGAPLTRVDLGSKVILTYPDVKLVFVEGKLSDVQ